jgi:RND superfamily putative drug exporter
MNAVFNWGWGSSLLHLSGTGPIDAFLPVLMFSVLFGLSMDYEVYLISRIAEQWHAPHQDGTGSRVGPAGRRNHLAITTGQATAHDPGTRTDRTDSSGDELFAATTPAGRGR